MSDALRIVFAGTPEFALPSLNALHHSKHQLHAVYTQPDRPAGRGRQLQGSAVKCWASEQAIPIYQPLNFKDPHVVTELAALQPDVLVVIAYGLILPRQVLSIPKFGCINVHASLLPRWRGASPIQQAILHGDAFSGVTIMQMAIGMDTGDGLRTISCPITETETAGSLHDKLALLAPDPLLATLDDLVTGQTQPIAQDDTLATYAPKINKSEAAIDWAQSASLIDQQIRAFNPWPIAYTQSADSVIRIHHATVEKISCSHAPGTVVAIDKKGILVATGDYFIRVQQVQFPGGKIIAIADWLNTGRAHSLLNVVLR